MKKNNETLTFGLTEVLIIMTTGMLLMASAMRFDETNNPVFGAFVVIFFSLLLLAFLKLKK